MKPALKLEVKPFAPHLILNKAFRRLKKRNPSYSLRALGRDIGLSAPYVSRLMKGEKPLTIEHIETFSKVLKMDEISIVSLRKAVVHSMFGATDFMPQPSPVVEVEEANDKEFSILEQWYNITILDLTTFEKIPHDTSYLASRLGIKESEAHFAIQKLVSLGYLEIENGILKKTQTLVRFPTTRSHPVVRDYHRAMLKKASDAMLATELEDFEKRLVAGISVATNPEQIAKARARLTEALYEVCEILRQGEATEVFQIAAQLFPLTRSTVK
jgi:uncharacterized protein (TIGR02147 family)